MHQHITRPSRSAGQLAADGTTDGHNDRGITTVELLVGMVITAIIGAFCLAFFVISSGTAGAQVARQQQQASLLDAINRVSRDVTYAQPITYASSTDMILQIASGSQRTAVRYGVQDGNLMVWTLVNPSAFPVTTGKDSDPDTDPGAADPRVADRAAWAGVTPRVLVARLDSTTVVPFTYTDRTGVVLLAPAAAPLLRVTAGTSKIGFVSMDFKAAPKDNKGFVELTGKARASSEAPIGVCLAPVS